MHLFFYYRWTLIYCSDIFFTGMTTNLSVLNTNQKWKDVTLVAFDTETSGAYPIGSDVVEFGAVKWKNGVEVARMNFLFKPRKPMSDFIIGIHKITNEMVATAPLIGEKLQDIRDFLDGAVLLAHHAPFDMGFMAYEFEKAKILLPSYPAICTSLLARNVIPESVNHKLQTLVKYLKIDGGQAHRATDDAFACLEVGLKCMERVGHEATLAEVYAKVGKDLRWNAYTILQSGSSHIMNVCKALENDQSLNIIYDGGSRGGNTRKIKPVGIVRNPDGDYIKAFCFIDAIEKRFYLSKISDMEITD